jgi:hypothetical protein
MSSRKKAVRNQEDNPPGEKQHVQNGQLLSQEQSFLKKTLLPQEDI